jgi:hypothetical protein
VREAGRTAQDLTTNLTSIGLSRPKLESKTCSQSEGIASADISALTFDEVRMAPPQSTAP